MFRNRQPEKMREIAHGWPTALAIGLMSLLVISESSFFVNQRPCGCHFGHDFLLLPYTLIVCLPSHPPPITNDWQWLDEGKMQATVTEIDT